MMYNSDGLNVCPDDLSTLFPLFQKGIWVAVETGCSLKDILCDQWEIPYDYVMERISTLFLDGKPVDDIETAVVRDKTTLALSSAMPGLVGAVMRRGGYYAALRGAITHHEDKPQPDHQQGKIRLKLFNLMLPELGPLFLRMGFWADRADVKNIFPDQLFSDTQDMIFIFSKTS